MSLVWKFLVISVDEILHINQNRHKQFIRKFEANVDIAVEEKMDRFERERLTFEN